MDFWRNCKYESIQVNENLTDDEKYCEVILNRFPKNRFTNFSDIDSVKNFIKSFTNWHKNVESDLEAMIFEELIIVNLFPNVNPKLKDIIDEDHVEKPLSEKEENMRLDLVLYVNNHPILIIELDGKQHEEQMISDADREVTIPSGLPRTYLLRVSSKEIRDNKKDVAKMIKRVYHYVSKRYLITEQYINELTMLDFDYEDVPDVKVRTALFKRDEDLASWLRELTQGY